MSLLGRRQARRRPAARRARGRLHRGRLARRAAQGHRVLRPGRAASSSCGTPRWSRSARPARPARGRRRPAGAGAAGRAGPGRLPRREVRPAARRPGAADHAGGEPARWSPTRSASSSPRAAGCSSTASTSSTATPTTATTALRVLEAAVTAGADVAVLCDTNGGMLPMGVAGTVAEVIARTGFRVGMHARTTPAARSPTPSPRSTPGATHVQGTANGYGERAGNADLFAVIGELGPRWACRSCPRAACRDDARRARLAEIANKAPDTQQAYVGASAFAHKAGLHASAIKVDPELYNHVDPGLVGNDMRILVTEMAGRASGRAQGQGARRGPVRPARRGRPVVETGQGPGGRRAGRSRPPTPRSSCSCATSWARRRPRRSRSSRTG